jgi:hypothetical protein
MDGRILPQLADFNMVISFKISLRFKIRTTKKLWIVKGLAAPAALKISLVCQIKI